MPLKVAPDASETWYRYSHELHGNFLYSHSRMSIELVEQTVYGLQNAGFAAIGLPEPSFLAVLTPLTSQTCL